MVNDMHEPDLYLSIQIKILLNKFLTKWNYLTKLSRFSYSFTIFVLSVNEKMYREIQHDYQIELKTEPPLPNIIARDVLTISVMFPCLT